MSIYESFYYSLKSYYLSTSVYKTVFKADFWVFLIYCSTNKICKCFGILGNSPLASAFIKQVLPIPFLPTRPYFFPKASLTEVLSKRVLPAIIKLILSRIRSADFPEPYLYLRI